MSKLTGLEKCDLHRRTPYGITNVSMTQFSIARYSGVITFNGETFVYFPETDELVRDDVLRWQKKQHETETKNRRRYSRLSNVQPDLL